MGKSYWRRVVLVALLTTKSNPYFHDQTQEVSLVAVVAWRISASPTVDYEASFGDWQVWSAPV